MLLALLCAAALLAFLWWQLMESTRVLNENTDKNLTGAVLPGGSISLTTPITPTGDEALTHLRQGDLFALRGDWANAQNEYEASVDAGGDIPALRKLAQAQLQRRDVRGVEATVRRLRAAGAKPADLLLLESVVDLRTSEIERARELLNNAEDSPQKHYGLALLHIITGNHNEAKQELAFVVNGWEPVLRSNARTILAAYDEFALFPESPDIHLVTLVSRALAQVLECELALPLLTQVIQERSDYRDAWIVQGYCELTTERPEKALESLEQAYTIDPQKPEIQYFLGRAYAASGDEQNAITFYEYALANGFTPEAEIRQELARAALMQGNSQLALEQYAALVQEEDATLETFEGLIETSLAIGEHERAELAAREAVKRWPEHGRAYELLGKTLMALDQNDEARSMLQRALELNPFLTESKDLLAK